MFYSLDFKKKFRFLCSDVSMFLFIWLVEKRSEQILLAFKKVLPHHSNASKIFSDVFSMNKTFQKYPLSVSSLTKNNY